nr:hypothetical protein [Tanacetum cinerariifolium]
LDSKIDKLDQKVTLLKLIVEDLEFEFSNCLMDHPNSSRIHHESEYGNVFSEMDNSLNFNDMSGNYNVGECSHGVDELDNDFINETNEENREDSSKEEILNQDSIEVNVLKVNEADSMAEKSTQDDI